VPGADSRGERDVITLTGVTARGRHGVLAEERRDGQDFVVDLELGLGLQGAAQTDDLHRTVNYAEVAALAVDVIQGEPQNLIETVADQIVTRVLAEHALVETVSVTVHKPQAPVGVPFADVAVTLRRRRDVPVVIALGANLGEASATLSRTGRWLQRGRGLRSVRLSPLFRTTPVGGPDQGDFSNAVAIGRTSLSAPALLEVLQQLEADAGRDRRREQRWGPRTLDLDLIQYGDPRAGTDMSSDDPQLQLPHPRAHERAFVLVPWLAVDPSAALRVDQHLRPVAELLSGLDTTGVQRQEQA